MDAYPSSVMVVSISGVRASTAEILRRFTFGAFRVAGSVKY